MEKGTGRTKMIHKDNEAIHVKIAKVVCKTLYIQYYNEGLYIYKNGVYTNDISILELEIIKVYRNATRNIMKEVLHHIETIKKSNIIEPDKNFINFKNGLYDLKNKKLIKHTPKIFTLNQINASYIANPPTNNDILNFFNDITSNNSERKKALLQIIGYCFTLGVELQKAFIFYGETAENGKSTLLEIINRLIGRENISHVSIHELQKSRFCSSELKNKLLNCVSELPRNNLDSVEVFKAVVTGDVMSVEEKFKKRYEIRPYAKHIFTSNELPSVSDTTYGFYRRINIIKFDAKFSEEQKNNFNINNILTDDAINYLARISLEAYLELIEERHFANEEESNNLIEEYKKKNDSFFYYINDSINFEKFMENNKNDTFRKSSLYENYITFCNTLHIKNIDGRSTFYKKIRQTNIFDEVTIHGIDCFKIKN